MRFVAQIEAVGSMTIAIAEREGADGDRQRLERGRRTLARRFARQNAGDVGLERKRLDGVAPSGPGEADAQLQLPATGRLPAAAPTNPSKAAAHRAPMRTILELTCILQKRRDAVPDAGQAAGQLMVVLESDSVTFGRRRAKASTVRGSTDGRAGPEISTPAARTPRRRDCTGSCLRRT